MFDKSRLRKKVILNLFSHPVTILPFAGSATFFIATWIFDLDPLIFLSLSFGCFVVSIGGLFTNLIVNLDKITKKAFEELQAESRQTQEKELDSLDRNLQEDRDARTEKLLRELRSLAATFEDGKAWSNNLDTRSAFEIESKVRELFQGCVSHLERSLELWRLAQEIDSTRGKEIILNQREKIIHDVETSVEQLGSILDGVLSLGILKKDDTELARIRDELDQSLEIARQVEERMEEFDKDKDIREP